MSSHRDNKGAAAPQPIPAGERRRNSFTGWPQSFFGISGRVAGQPGPGPAESPLPANNPLHTARTFSGAGSASLPDSSSASLPGMGLFRRFSASQVPAQAQPQHPAAAQQLGEAFGTHGPDMHAPGAAKAGAHWPATQRLPRALEEVREADDPPSRPDSRMRNLMLSGQFLI